jgi:hypothetical protein
MSFDRRDGNGFRGNGTEAVAYTLPGTVRSRLERYGAAWNGTETVPYTLAELIWGWIWPVSIPFFVVLC